ncbi:hypothetical protein MKEN_00174800 [Mycena kentingensis (nom. inval.)]|nr:hypothetical protein MKEN_00174800 [Mycena kentingensis (nom. inval.)]
MIRATQALPMSPAPTTSVLPEDLWRYIAAYIPSVQLRTLISVNYAFLGIALDEIYRDVRLDGRMLERLRVPGNAARVRHLEISDTKLKPSDETAEAVALMSGVVSVDLEWRDPGLVPEMSRFLSAARATFVHLRKLSLFGQMRTFAQLVAFVDYPNLEELALQFGFDPETANSDLPRSVIAPFINAQRQRLRVLTVTSIATTDMAPLFDALEDFECLEQVFLTFVFDSNDLTDAILHFFSANATTDKLSLFEVTHSMSPRGFHKAWNRFCGGLRMVVDDGVWDVTVPEWPENVWVRAQKKRARCA